MTFLALDSDGRPIVDTHGSALTWPAAVLAADWGTPLPVTPYRPHGRWAGKPRET